jgi:glycosyltransferase involved in cell wall biosynthesis
MEEKKLNKLKLIIGFYNPGDFIDTCISSVLTQDYDNYEILFIDDCSTDESYKKIPACIYSSHEDGTPKRNNEGELIILEKHPLLEDTKCKNVTLWRASSQATALPNIHNAMMQFCTDPDDICVFVDGDDWLMKGTVLSEINDLYNKYDCWITYGQAIWTDGRRGCASKYSPMEYKHVRKAPFRISHLRTWRAGLYHKIAEQDPTFSCLKDSNNEFYKWGWDTAVMFALMELTPYEKLLYNESVLYVYNRDNPISEDKINQSAQWAVHEETSNKKSLKQIQNYK